MRGPIGGEGKGPLAGGLLEACGALQPVVLEEAGIRLRVYTGDCIYPPSEDTLLAVKALIALREAGASYESIVELGSGSGALSLAARILFNPARQACCDLNPCAALASARSVGACLPVSCWGCRCLRPGWDLAIVNPPYLDEEPPETAGVPSCGEGGEALWWSGGSGVMEALLLEAMRLAREIIVVYSSLSPVNPLELALKWGLTAKILGEEAFFMEKLRVAWIGPAPPRPGGYGGLG